MKASEEKVDRNREIYEAVEKQRRSYRKVAREYDISATRVQQIVSRQRKRERSL